MSQLRVINKPIKGSFLVAEPMLGDPNFDRSVILLTEHNENGSVGFVLNRPLDLNLEDIVIDFPFLDTQVYHGGPVQQDNLYFIHNKGNLIPGSEHIRDELYWGGDLKPLKEMIECGLMSEENIRFFLGYSGWSSGQLKDELKEKSWLAVDDAQVNLFEDQAVETWQKVLMGIGGEYPLWANSPVDPNLN